VDVGTRTALDEEGLTANGAKRANWTVHAARNDRLRPLE
jgi:hypothetical protein